MKERNVPIAVEVGSDVIERVSRAIDDGNWQWLEHLSSLMPSRALCEAIEEARGMADRISTNPGLPTKR